MSNGSKHPMQPIVWDPNGVARYKENYLVWAMVEKLRELGYDLNWLCSTYPPKTDPDGNDWYYPDDDWTQLAQLIGYSVSGAGDLSYFDPRVTIRSDKIVAREYEKKCSK